MRYDNEIWKDIKGYEGLYQVSNLGRVKSLNYNHTKKEKILKPQLMRNGYLRINLHVINKNKIFNVHRLVADAFIPNTDKKTQVNHINEIKTDNRASNLEWMNCKENVNYGTGIKRRALKRLKPVIATNLENGEQIKFNSLKEADEKGFSKSEICNCCKGKLKNHKGYIWRYADEVEIQG